MLSPASLEEMTMASGALEQLRNKALELTEAERAELAHDLVASLDGAPDPAAAVAWDAEILQRVTEIDEGTATLVDSEEVSKRIRARVRGN
jgi:putative addiction module component (TIGR02574 family)